MNADRLLALYEKVAEAPDAIARLRRSVIDMSIAGGFSGGRASWANQPIEDCLEPLEDGKSIHQGWSPRCETFPASSAEKWGVLKTTAVQDGFFLEEGNKELPDRLSPKENLEISAGDVLMTCAGPRARCGIACWVSNVRPRLMISGKMYRFRADQSRILTEYLALFLRSTEAWTAIDTMKTGSSESGLNLTKDRFRKLKVSFGTLDEQRQILAKVEELMALLDRLEVARTAREATRDRLTAASLARLTAPDADAADFSDNARFALATLPALTARPDQIKPLRQTILNLAVRGKLLEQDPADEPASELLTLLARKKAKHGKGRNWSNGEAPTDGLAFEAPVGWAWTTIDQTALRVTVGHVGPMKDKYVKEGIPFLRSQNVRANAFRPDGLTFISPEFHQKIIKSALAPGDVVVVRSGNVGTACVIPPELPVANCSDLVVVQSPEAVAPEYLCFYLNSLASVHVEAGAVGVALTHFNTKSVATMPFPLPPLAEQHRIVAQVDALMALCDRLEAALRAADTTRARLLGALLADALNPASMQEMEAAE